MNYNANEEASQPYTVNMTNGEQSTIYTKSIIGSKVSKASNVFMELHPFIFLGAIDMIASFAFVFGIALLLFSPLIAFSLMTFDTVKSLFPYFVWELLDRIIIKWICSFDEWVKIIIEFFSNPPAVPVPPTNPVENSFLQDVFGTFSLERFLSTVFVGVYLIIAYLVISLGTRLWGHLFYRK